MLAGYSFRPRAWALALALAGCAAGVALGNWQNRRADEKRELAARIERGLQDPPLEIGAAPIDAKNFALRRVAARGEFVARHDVFLENKVRQGRLGYEVVTPLRLGEAMHVLVDRGWIERGSQRAMTPIGTVRVEGLALERLPHALELGGLLGAERQNIDIDAFAKETGLRLQPVIIQEHAGPADGLVRQWPRADGDVDRHAAYALQWYSLAALAVALFVVLSFRKRENPPQ